MLNICSVNEDIKMPRDTNLDIIQTRSQPDPMHPIRYNFTWLGCSLILESQCVELIQLRTISLIDVSAWNSLPSSLAKSKSVASFKYNLRSIDLSSFKNFVL